MKIFSFKKIDAFATVSSSGNPAGVISLGPGDDISEREMQKIARELKGFVSEVCYLRPTSDGLYMLRYFSSEREVEFCGHATIAAMYDLVRNDENLLTERYVSIVTNKGRLEIENRIATENAVFITAPDPIFSPAVIGKDGFAESANIKQKAISEDYPISVVNAGLETLIVPIKSLDAILSLSLQMQRLKTYCLENSIDIITVFTVESANSSNSFRTRVFAPTFGYLEDPATGSGNAALGYYLLKHNRWDGRPITLEQNGDIDNPNIINLTTKTTATGKMHVLFGGGAIVRVQGEYLLT